MKKDHFKRISSLLAISCFILLQHWPSSAASTGLETLKWHDPKKEKIFSVEGLPWFPVHGLYRRLPLDQENKEFRPEVNHLADQPAGVQIRFNTTSQRVVIHTVVGDAPQLDNMPESGQSGTDAYVREAGETKARFCGLAYSGTGKKEYQETVCARPVGHMREYIVNLPLYNSVRILEIGLDDDAVVEWPHPHAISGKIAVYGTSITQGGVAPRPGLAWTNILSRSLDAEVVNLGFSGAGKGEPALASRIAEIEDLRLVILDYEANAKDGVKTTMAPFIDLIRAKHPNVPLIIISQIRWTMEQSDADYAESKKKLREFQAALVRGRVKAGDHAIYFVDGSKLLGGADFGEGLTDGAHPNALGMYRIAFNLLPKVRKILRNNK